MLLHTRAVMSSRNKGSLVTDVSDISPGKTGSQRGHLLGQWQQFQICLYRFEVDHEYGNSALYVRSSDVDLSVKPARSEQGRVQGVFSVCSGQHYNVRCAWSVRDREIGD